MLHIFINQTGVSRYQLRRQQLYNFLRPFICRQVIVGVQILFIDSLTISILLMHIFRYLHENAQDFFEQRTHRRNDITSHLCPISYTITYNQVDFDMPQYVGARTLSCQLLFVNFSGNDLCTVVSAQLNNSLPLHTYASISNWYFDLIRKVDRFR